MYKNYYVLQQFSSYRNVVHAISTRAAGDMEFRRGGGPQADNRLKLAQSLGIPEDNFVKMEQTHGTAIAVVDATDTAAIDSVASIPGVDGLITQEKGVFLFAKTADCLPILYFDPKERVLGLAHAGWRGVVGKLPALMVSRMITAFGCQAKNIVIGIGPCLDKTANLVEPPIIQTQLPEWQDFYSVEGDRIRLDLVGFTQNQLISVGVPEANIDVGGICTASNTDEFFSAYADGDPGRFATIIGIRSFDHEAE